jgi:hypothetical protein
MEDSIEKFVENVGRISVERSWEFVVAPFSPWRSAG